MVAVVFQVFGVDCVLPGNPKIAKSSAVARVPYEQPLINEDGPSIETDVVVGTPKECAASNALDNYIQIAS